MQGVFTKFLQLWIPNKTDKGTVVTDVFEPNFTKLDENAKSNNETLTNLSNNKLDKGTYSGNAGTLKTEIDKKLDKGTYPGNASDLNADISGKMDKYKNAMEIISDYDDVIEDGFYMARGSAQGALNAPYGDPALVQVWTWGNYVYQNAVSYHDVKSQFTRCFYKEVKNTKWERIANTATLGFVKIGECLRVDQSVSIYGYDEFVVCELYSPSIMLDIKYFTKEMVNSLKSFKFESYVEVLECEWVFSADGNTITLKNLGAGSDGGIYVYGR